MDVRAKSGRWEPQDAKHITLTAGGKEMEVIMEMCKEVRAEVTRKMLPQRRVVPGILPLLRRLQSGFSRIPGCTTSADYVTTVCLEESKLGSDNMTTKTFFRRWAGVALFGC
jgi:hypothetical protein